MSWCSFELEKTQLQSEVVWIGWEISTRDWTVTLTSQKRASILEDLQELLRVHKIPLKLLETDRKIALGNFSMASIEATAESFVSYAVFTTPDTYFTFIDRMESIAAVTG